MKLAYDLREKLTQLHIPVSNTESHRHRNFHTDVLDVDPLGDTSMDLVPCCSSSTSPAKLESQEDEARPVTKLLEFPQVGEHCHGIREPQTPNLFVLHML